MGWWRRAYGRLTQRLHPGGEPSALPHMLWRLANLGDARQLAELTNATSKALLTSDEALRFLAGWSVEIGLVDHELAAAVAVLPPTSKSGRHAHGTWWDRRSEATSHVTELVQRTVEVARRTRTTSLQFALPIDDRDRITAVESCGFNATFRSERWATTT